MKKSKKGENKMKKSKKGENKMKKSKKGINLKVLGIVMGIVIVILAIKIITNRPLPIMNFTVGEVNHGHNPQQGKNPMYTLGGIAVYDSKVYVCNIANNTIDIFTESGNYIRYIRSFGGLGKGKGKFNQPSGIDINLGKIYVADTMNHRIQIFNLDGQYLAEIKRDFFC